MEECYGCNYYIMGLCCYIFDEPLWEAEPAKCEEEDYGD